MSDDSILTQLQDEANQLSAPHSFILALPNYGVQVHSNSSNLIETLTAYFGKDLVQDTSIQPALTLTALETDRFIDLGLDWQDWKRDAGKSGRKDAFVDIEQDQQTHRLIYKVKTGMLFWQNATHPMAFGPTEANPNQIINFILTQFLNHQLRQGDLLGHAAGLQLQGKGLAIAGLSGGGKSTLMLHLMEQGQHFVSNDRLLLNQESENNAENNAKKASKTTRPGDFEAQNTPKKHIMRGIPKHPRINPGTIVHNPRIESLIPAERRAELLAWPVEQLRALEEKYDVDVNQFYGDGCYLGETQLDALVVLNWGQDQTTQLNVTTLNQRPDLLPAIMKSPGPFFANAQGQFLRNALTPDEQAYLNGIGDLPCFELQGQIDFDQAVKLVLNALQTS